MNTNISNALYVRQSVNIYSYPNDEDIMSPPAGIVITLGDLHGNAARLLHMLVREGMLDISKSDYNKFINIYKKSDKKYDLNKLLEILKNIKLKEPCPMLRLIGDDMSDRGKNDLLTLLIYQRLDELGAKIRINASNHGIEFLKQYAKGINHEELVILFQDTPAHQYKHFGASLYGLRKDIDDGRITAEAVEKIIRDHYLSKLELLSYLVNDENSITIYSHAPIDLVKIDLLAGLFNVDYKESTMQEFCETLDAINAVFTEIVTDKNLLSSFFEKASYFPDDFNIFDHFIGDRYEQLVSDETPCNFSVINIHGHVGERFLDSSPNASFTYQNLDSDLGKSDTHIEHGYLCYLAQESPESFENKNIAINAEPNPFLEYIKSPTFSSTATVSHVITIEQEEPAQEQDIYQLANQYRSDKTNNQDGRFILKRLLELHRYDRHTQHDLIVTDLIDQIYKLYEGKLIYQTDQIAQKKIAKKILKKATNILMDVIFEAVDEKLDELKYSKDQDEYIVLRSVCQILQELDIKYPEFAMPPGGGLIRLVPTDASLISQYNKQLKLIKGKVKLSPDDRLQMLSELTAGIDNEHFFRKDYKKSFLKRAALLEAKIQGRDTKHVREGEDIERPGKQE